MVTSKQCFGDPIDCLVEDVPENVINTFCWTHSTFTTSDRMASEVIGRDVPHPDVGIQRKGDSVKYHKYYQGVCFVLFFQWEGGKMKSIVLNLNLPIFTKDATNNLKLSTTTWPTMYANKIPTPLVSSFVNSLLLSTISGKWFLLTIFWAVSLWPTEAMLSKWLNLKSVSIL